MAIKQWYAVYCRAQQEKVACDNLLNQDVEVYLPFYKKVVRHARQVREVVAPLFPRYLFVSFDIKQAQWRCINSTRGVQRLVMFNGEQPQGIPSQIIKGLKQTEDEAGLVSLAGLDLFQKGESVRILEGTFAGHVAIYQKMPDRQRVEILLHFLNSDVRMQVPVHTVEKAV